MSMDVVSSWTGGRADALRAALRMTNEAFAGHLGVGVRTVAYWRGRPDVVPRPDMQEILDAALARVPASVRAQFTLLLREREYGPRVSKAGTSSWVPDDAAGVSAWITSSNTSNEAIERLGVATASLADMHSQAPPRTVLADVLEVHHEIQALLQGGKQRLRQTRELIRIDSDALAHASVLLGDLGQDQTANSYGHTARLGIQEAEASPAKACYALAKTARWQHKYADAADLARQGFEYGPGTDMSVQLAYYEANCAALLGDGSRARTALARAERIAEAMPSASAASSPWSFPAERRAIFALSVALRTGDTSGALRAAAAADHGWAGGDPVIPGTWAQVRIGAAVAHLLQDSLDGTVAEVTPLFTLPPDFRIATVTGWLNDLYNHLSRRRFARSPAAVGLRRQIRDFNAHALPPHSSGEAG